MNTTLDIDALKNYEPSRLKRPDLQSAAVLIPVVRSEEGDRIILTVRHERLKYQPGAISFPGGKLEPDDADLLQCALRETEEEISLSPARIEILAEMDKVTVSSRYLVTPFAGLVAPGAPLTPNAGEVTRLISVHVADLLVPATLQTITRAPGDVVRPVYKFTIRDVTIWGATARMLKRFLEVGYGARYPEGADE